MNEGCASRREKGQPYGDKAKQELARLVFGKTARVETTGKDRYRRTLGCMFVGGIDVNARLVGQGLAWHYLKYLQDKGLAAAEREARAKRRGLWAEPQPIPPWDWRKARKLDLRKSASTRYAHLIN